MIFWFIGGACLIVVLVFGDPRIDYRMVALGAVLPDLPLTLTPLHSLTAAVGLLALVMLGTRGNRRRRRLLLAVPIGMLLHLVLDGMWDRTDVFWWPFGGEFEGGPLPPLERGAVLLVMQEVAGLVALWWTTARLAALREGAAPGSGGARC